MSAPAARAASELGGVKFGRRVPQSFGFPSGLIAESVRLTTKFGFDQSVISLASSVGAGITLPDCMHSGELSRVQRETDAGLDTSLNGSSTRSNIVSVHRIPYLLQSIQIIIVLGHGVDGKRDLKEIPMQMRKVRASLTEKRNHLAAVDLLPGSDQVLRIVPIVRL